MNNWSVFLDMIVYFEFGLRLIVFLDNGYNVIVGSMFLWLFLF